MRAKASPVDIDSVLKAIGKLWLEHPAQRLGQLLLNLSRNARGDIDDLVLWNLDEQELLKRIRACDWAPAHNPKTCTSQTCDYRSCK